MAFVVEYVHQMGAMMMMMIMMLPHLKKRNVHYMIQMTKLATLLLWVEGHVPSMAMNR